MKVVEDSLLFFGRQAPVRLLKHLAAGTSDNEYGTRRSIDFARHSSQCRGSYIRRSIQRMTLPHVLKSERDVYGEARHRAGMAQFGERRVLRPEAPLGRIYADRWSTLLQRLSQLLLPPWPVRSYNGRGMQHRTVRPKGRIERAV